LRRRRLENLIDPGPPAEGGGEEDWKILLIRDLRQKVEDVKILKFLLIRKPVTLSWGA
jgi:hypothetical protein